MILLKVPNFLTEQECSIIYDRILETEDYVKSLGEDVHGGTADNSLTGRHWINNYLFDDVIGPILIPKLKVLFVGNVWIQCWANTFRKGEGITSHCHRPPAPKRQPPFPWSCVNLFIGGDPTIGTWFEGEKQINDPGEIMVFESETHHWVDPNPTDQIRISMAMDVHPYKLPPDRWSNPKHYYHLQ